MGNAQTKMYTKLDAMLPRPSKIWVEDGDLLPGNKPAFNQKDRKRFIYSVITVMTENGRQDLSEHHFRLMYSRRGNDRIVARIVAQRDGVATARVETDEDGEDQRAAFRALRRCVERRLEYILQDVPGGQERQMAAVGLSTAGGGSRAIAGPSTSNMPSDALPTYANVMSDGEK